MVTVTPSGKSTSSVTTLCLASAVRGAAEEYRSGFLHGEHSYLSPSKRLGQLHELYYVHIMLDAAAQPLMTVEIGNASQSGSCWAVQSLHTGSRHCQALQFV